MKIEIQSKVYHNQDSVVEALKDVNMSFDTTGIHVIIGESGAGKTTLLNIIAQEDTDFSGHVETEGIVSYVKQDIELLETLKVIQHLHMASTDANAVNEVMQNLHIDHLKNKKIKHLSLGQMRRVQFACALLTPCSYLICDEPTASLDKENAKIIMEELKRRKDSICIILVSHDGSILNTYADEVYQLENCTLVKEKRIHEGHPISFDNDIQRKKKRTFLVTLELLYSRLFEHVFRCTLCVLMVLSMIGGTMFFSHIHSSQRKKDSWYYEENVIVSQPKNYEEMGYLDYDTYTQNELDQIREFCPDVIGYEWGWDIDLYLTFASPEEAANGYTYHPFLMNTLGKIYIKDDTENGYEGWENIGPVLSEIGIDPELYGKEYYDNRRLRVFQMFQIDELPLSIGIYPTSDHEAIIDTTAAEYYCKMFELSSIDDLVGKEISFYTYPNAYDIDMIVERTKYSVEISGITTLNSQRNPRIYTTYGAYDRFLAESYLFQSDLPEHMYMNLLLHEQKEKTLDTINKILESDKNHFVWSKDSNDYLVNPVNETAIYQSPFVIYAFSFGACMLILLVIVISEWLLRKRSEKEERILTRFGFNPHNVKYTELILYYGIACAVSMPFIQTYAPLLHDAFFKIHQGFLILVSAICALIHIVIFSMINSRRKSTDENH